MKDSYIAIDLKSFYASVECNERGLDPLTTNLLVADPSRTEKTICLAVSPSLKSFGVPSRPRLFEAVAAVKSANNLRARRAGGTLVGSSYDAVKLAADPYLSVDYVTAVPRMALYIEYSKRIYEVYLRHVAPEDIHVYSIDEVFIYATPYVKLLGITPKELAERIVLDVLKTTGITATAGIGTNMYLCKVAMDIIAKKEKPNRYGVRVAELDEMSYRRLLWSHTPLTDFWRVGKGYVEKLASVGLKTMGDIARCSLGKERDYYNEELLYRLFGINAELLIDHAWGRESCSMADVKAYRPSATSLSSGQVLQCPYDYGKARIVIREMADALSLDLVAKALVTDRVTLAVGYERESLDAPPEAHRFETVLDCYGRRVPKGTHGYFRFPKKTSSTKEIVNAIDSIAERILDKRLRVRRINICADGVVSEQSAGRELKEIQLDIFSLENDGKFEKDGERVAKMREKRIQKALLEIKNKHGANAVIRAMSLEEGATARIRGEQIGGHRA